MALNDSVINGAQLNGSAGVTYGNPFVLSFDIDQDNETLNYEAPFTLATISLDQTTQAVLYLSVQINQNIYDTLPNFSLGTSWGIEAVVAGQDISSRIIGSIDVDAEEGVARTSKFSIVPNAGTIELDSWVGAPVFINYQILENSVVTWAQRIFTGIVDDADYDNIKNTVTFTCTDDLQVSVENLTNTQIDTLTPGSYFAKRLSDENIVGWEYLVERMKTIEGAVDLDVYRNFRLTSWGAKATEDKEYTESGILFESARSRPALSKDLLNEINIEFSYRYQRLKERQVSGSWTFPDTFCEYLNGSRTLPNVPMIRDALEGSGWTIKSFSNTELPDTGSFNCPGLVYWVISPQLQGFLSFGASWTVFKRFSQTITEKYQIKIKAPISSVATGTRPETRQAGFTAQYETGPFESSTETDNPKITGGSPQDGNAGDYYADQVGETEYARADSDNCLEVLIRSAVKDIRASHRKNLVSWDVPFDPDLDVSGTYKLTTVQLTAKGKAKRITHSLNLESGECVSTIQVAVSRKFGAGAYPETAIAIPVPPDTTGGAPPGSSNVSTTTQYGGLIASPAYDENLDGYSGNYLPSEAGATEFYPTRFAWDGEAIEGTSIDDLEFVQTQEYDIMIPNDDLAVVA